MKWSLLLRADVEQGKNIEQQHGKIPKDLQPILVSLVEVGEASGTMPMVLEKLTAYSEQQAEFQSTIISALVYPAVLFVICVGAIAFFRLFVARVLKVFLIPCMWTCLYLPKPCWLFLRSLRQIFLFDRRRCIGGFLC